MITPRDSNHDNQVSSWGGYVFLINLIPLHVLTLMITGRFSHRTYVAYCIVSNLSFDKFRLDTFFILFSSLF